MLGLGIIRVEPSCCANAVLAVVAYLLKASIVEPEKQLLLANGSETTLVSWKWLGKIFRGNRYACNNRAIVVFSTHFVQRGDKKDNWDNQISSVGESEEKSHLEGSRHSKRT
jgi:hypothetical protein